MSLAESLPVDRLHALQDFLDMYHWRDEDVLLNEAFANGVDIFLTDGIKNGKIEITFDRVGDDIGYINFHNNGSPMNQSQFEKYHKIAGSYKKKGGGIGFAGVGAKVFLVSNQGGEIITMTGEDNSNFMASKMFRTENDVKYIKSWKSPLSEILGNYKYKHTYGTTYRVRLTKFAYGYLKENINNIISFWWNYALLTKQFTVIVDGKQVKPFDPPTRFKKSFIWKKNKINCFCWITKDTIPVERRHIVYSVFGKRIINEPILIPISIKGDFSNRIFCLVDVTHISNHLETDKENFKGNWQTNQTRQATQKFFIDFLKENGLVGKDLSKPETNEIVNELTKELDRLLKTKEFKDLNPFLSPRKRKVPMPNEDGDITISEVEGEGAGSGKGRGKGTDVGHGEGKAFVEDEEGDRIGSHKERQSKGIRIVPTDEFPNEKEEAWVDVNKGSVILNVLHPFFIHMQSLDKYGRFEKFNINRILIDALIKFKSKELNWNPETTLNRARDLLHKTWMKS